MQLPNTLLKLLVLNFYRNAVEFIRYRTNRRDHPHIGFLSAILYAEWPVMKHQWIIEFDNVHPIEPFKFVAEDGKTSLGKQGVGILDKKYHHLIKPLQDAKK